MEGQYLIVTKSLEVDIELISDYHDGSSIFLNTSPIDPSSGKKILNKLVKIIMKAEWSDEIGNHRIHPDYDIDKVVEKHLPSFDKIDELIVLASNVIDTDWEFYAQDLVTTKSGHLISIYEDVTFALIEVQKLIRLKEDQKKSSITFNAYKENETNAEPAKGGRGKGETVIDKESQVILSSKEDVEFILNQIIDYKIKLLESNHILESLIINHKIKVFDLENIEWLLSAVRIPFNQARAFEIFRKQLAITLYSFIKALVPESTKKKNKYLLLYSTLLLFNMIKPALHNEHDNDNKKEKYIDTLLRRHRARLEDIRHLNNEIKKKESNGTDTEEISELQTKKALLEEELFPLVNEVTPLDTSKENFW